MPVGINLKDRADRRVDFSVHEHDVLSVRKRIKNDVGAKVDRASDINEDVDQRRAGEKKCILRHDRPT